MLGKADTRDADEEMGHEGPTAIRHRANGGATTQPHTELNMPPGNEEVSGRRRGHGWGRSQHGSPGHGLTPHHIREHPGFKRNKLTLLSMGIAVVLVCMPPPPPPPPPARPPSLAVLLCLRCWTESRSESMDGPCYHYVDDAFVFQWWHGCYCTVHFWEE